MEETIRRYFEALEELHRGFGSVRTLFSGAPLSDLTTTHWFVAGNESDSYVVWSNEPFDEDMVRRGVLVSARVYPGVPGRVPGRYAAGGFTMLAVRPHGVENTQNLSRLRLEVYRDSLRCDDKTLTDLYTSVWLSESKRQYAG